MSAFSRARPELIPKRRFWWLLLGLAGLLIGGGVAAVVYLRHDGLEEKAAQIREGMTEKDVLGVMGRTADEQVLASNGSDVVQGLPVFRWTDGRQTVQVTFNDRWVVQEVRVWENETLLERLWNWLGW